MGRTEGAGGRERVGCALHRVRLGRGVHGEGGMCEPRV